MEKLLNEFLPSVIEFSKGHDIYVVDNASKDDSVKFLQQNFPNVNAIELSKNYGYAGGYNRAVQQIDAELLCFLNSDVRVSKNWLKPIIKSFKKDRSMAIAQPKILDQKIQICSNMLEQPEVLLTNLDTLIVAVGFLIPLKLIMDNTTTNVLYFGLQALVFLSEKIFL